MTKQEGFIFILSHNKRIFCQTAEKVYEFLIWKIRQKFIDFSITQFKI